MKLRLGDVVMAIAHIAYTEKVADDIVEIYFVGLREPLKVYCNEDRGNGVRYEGSADELISSIWKQIDNSDITYRSRLT